MTELEITYDEVREEHVKGVKTPAHWAYLIGVLAGSFVLMVLLIALLDAL
jgi:hypothetical protein